VHAGDEVVRLTSVELESTLFAWQEAWNRHDLEGVLALFDNDVLFDHWTGQQVRGKALLRRLWAPWFACHGDFRFVEVETLFDEAQQKAVYAWRLEWPSQEAAYAGRAECRSGVDVLHFRNGRITQKLSYSKTTLTIDGKPVPLVAGPA
jgi:ketosteroid isomerase-like protein